MDHVLVRSSKALGSGRVDGITHILHVPSDIFDSAKTQEMAAEIAQFNSQVKKEGGSYLLIGPGRWGSSDPWLGIPVMWSEISEARMIVESAIPGYQIEPSQGTHFFQNLTSFGVGYLTLGGTHDTFDRAWLDTQPAVWESLLIRHVRCTTPLHIKMDGLHGIGVVEKPQ